MQAVGGPLLRGPELVYVGGHPQLFSAKGDCCGFGQLGLFAKLAKRKEVLREVIHTRRIVRSWRCCSLERVVEKALSDWPSFCPEVCRDVRGARQFPTPALTETRDRRLCREELGTFEDYCRACLRRSRFQGYRLITQAAMVIAIGMSPIGDKLGTEPQARDRLGCRPYRPKSL